MRARRQLRLRLAVVGVACLGGLLAAATCGDDCDVECAPCPPPTVNWCKGHACGCKPGLGYPSPLSQPDLAACAAPDSRPPDAGADGACAP